MTPIFELVLDDDSVLVARAEAILAMRPKTGQTIFADEPRRDPPDVIASLADALDAGTTFLPDTGTDANMLRHPGLGHPLVRP